MLVIILHYINSSYLPIIFSLALTMYRSVILVCLLIGSTVSIRCWVGQDLNTNSDPRERSGNWSATDTDCYTISNQITCSRSHYNGTTYYGCGTAACEGSPEALKGCDGRVVDCKDDLCNVGMGYNGVDSTRFLKETVCESGENTVADGTMGQICTTLGVVKYVMEI